MYTLYIPGIQVLSSVSVSVSVWDAVQGLLRHKCTGGSAWLLHVLEKGSFEPFRSFLGDNALIKLVPFYYGFDEE